MEPMENKVINVVGFPSDILEVKLRRFIEKYTGPESIDGIERRDDGETEITFKTAESKNAEYSDIFEILRKAIRLNTWNEGAIKRQET